MQKRHGFLGRTGDVSITTIILIIIGLVVAVMVILGFTNFTDLFFGTAETIDPGRLEILAQACSGYIQAGTTIAYCQYRDMDVEVNGKDLYANCEYSPIREAVLKTTTIPEGFSDCALAVTTFCDSNSGTSSKFLLNGVSAESQCGAVGAVRSCKNTPFTCTSITNEMSCGKQKGCKWDVNVNPRCIFGMEANTCTDKVTGNDAAAAKKASCEMLESGCVWTTSGTCVPGVAPCSLFTDSAACGMQAGCNWA
jgi:hypothetical protein